MILRECVREREGVDVCMGKRKDERECVRERERERVGVEDERECVR